MIEATIKEPPYTVSLATFMPRFWTLSLVCHARWRNPILRRSTNLKRDPITRAGEHLGRSPSSNAHSAGDSVKGPGDV